MSRIISHSPQLDHSGDAAQVHTNPWSSHSRDENSPPSTVIVRDYIHAETGSVPQDDTLTVSPELMRWQDSDMILSPSPPPQSAESTQPQPPTPTVMQVQEPPQTDPRVASLKAIFPDFDDAVIISVLESAGDDHDRALDVLLGMSDPSFVPPTSAPPSSRSPDQSQFAPSNDAQRLSQEALDEQFARRLALEEQEAAQDVPSYIMYQPYRQGSGRNNWGSPPRRQSQTQAQGGRDTMTEFQDGFNRIAESGKKTFSSIVSKVRAKMQDFEQGQGWSGSQNPPPDQHLQSASYPSHTLDAGPSAYSQPQARPARTNTYPTSSPPRSGILRPAVVTDPVQHPSYYDPNARGYDLYGDDDATIAEVSPIATAPPSVLAAAAQQPATVTWAPRVQRESPESMSPRVSPSPPLEARVPAVVSPPRSQSISPLASTPIANAGASPPARSLSPTTMTTGASLVAKGAVPTRGAPSAVDFSKLGLLPKRPISLVRPQSPPVASAATGADKNVVGAPRMAVAHSESTTDSSTDREEPEFVENPFEDPFEDRP